MGDGSLPPNAYCLKHSEAGSRVGRDRWDRRELSVRRASGVSSGMRLGPTSRRAAIARPNHHSRALTATLKTTPRAWQTIPRAWLPTPTVLRLMRGPEHLALVLTKRTFRSSQQTPTPWQSVPRPWLRDFRA